MNELKETPEFQETAQEWDTWEPGPWLRKTSIYTRSMREGREQGLAEGREEGRERGLQQALKLVLSSRGLTASPEQLALIDACTSSTTLERWLGQATRVNSVAELLAA